MTPVPQGARVLPSDLATPDLEPDDAIEVEWADAEHPDVGRPAHLRVAPRVSRAVLRRRRRARLAVFGVAAISAASMFVLVAFHVFAAQSAFTLDKLDTQLATQQRQYGILRARVAELSSPEAVANAAARLQMVRASQVTVLHVPAVGALGPTDGLPVPPQTPYQQIAAGP